MEPIGRVGRRRKMTPASDLVAAPVLASSDGEACVSWPMRAPARSRVSPESDLVQQAQRGDSAAYAELVRPHQRPAFHAAWLITRSAQDAEEALQEGLFKAYRAISRFRADEPFRPWLIRIVSNEAYTMMRRRSRRSALQQRAQQEIRPEWTSAPEDRVVASEANAALVHALQALSERDRQVISCRYLLELSEEETATVLRCRRGTVKSRLSRALDRLRELVESEEFGVMR
jgi:RNA polymerase sigma factor (sigma-70 family)